VLTPVVETNGGRSAARRFRPFFVADENQFANRNVSSRFQGPPKYLQRSNPHTSIVEGTKCRCNCANSRSAFALATPFCTVMCGRQPCKSWELSHGLNVARYQSRISVNRAPRESRMPEPRSRTPTNETENWWLSAAISASAVRIALTSPSDA
jgi:hypothetical protein